jgi:drug/metabolite transporter (DMT)-like permease
VFVIDVATALLTLAQVAIGLAGFSAILVALSGKPHQWTPVDAFRIRNILALSFQSVFLSLIPFVLAFFSLPESTVWKVSLLIIAIATLGVCCWCSAVSSDCRVQSALF